MLIIAFGFKARRGKDTAARAIKEARGHLYDIREYAFADALRREVKDAVEHLLKHGWNEQDAVRTLCHQASVPYDSNPSFDEQYPYGKQRSLLQWWGTEHRREQDPLYWVKQMALTLDHENPQVALIKDMRFRNEMYFVRQERRDRKGVAVRLDRTGYSDPLDRGQQTHRSEQELQGVGLADPDHQKFGFDYILEAASVEELKTDAVKLFDMIAESMKPPSDFSLASFEGADDAEEIEATNA